MNPRDQLLRATDGTGRELGFISIQDGKITVMFGPMTGVEVSSLADAKALLSAPRCRRCGGPITEDCHNDAC